MRRSWLTLPNAITVGRILVCPAIFLLAMASGAGDRFGAFLLFVAAGLSDVWDGHLARKQGSITDLGKLLDPIADKLLLAATFIPFYIISHRGTPADVVPWWGVLPMWVMVIVFGREIVVTAFRSWAAGRGVVIAAGRSGKLKALFQSLFSGGLLLWYPLRMTAVERGWTDSGLWTFWRQFHGAWVGITLGVALALSIYSMGVYLWSYRGLLGAGRSGGA